jgi:hypothetical protein
MKPKILKMLPLKLPNLLNLKLLMIQLRESMRIAKARRMQVTRR